MAEFQVADEGIGTDICGPAARDTCLAMARKKVEARRMLEDVLEESRQRHADWNSLHES